MISLCEKCRNYNWRKMQTIIDTFREAGLDRPRHIWCHATHRPEDIHEVFCVNFEPYETHPRSHQIKSKARYCNNANKLSGHRKITPRKAYK